jgi:hypothetical protein
MKIDITVEHEGVTKTICTYEFEPIVGQSEDVTNQVFDAINSNISFFMMGQSWFRQGKEYRSGQLTREGVKTKSSNCKRQ